MCFILRCVYTPLCNLIIISLKNKKENGDLVHVSFVNILFNGTIFTWILKKTSLEKFMSNLCLKFSKLIQFSEFKIDRDILSLEHWKQKCHPFKKNLSSVKFDSSYMSFVSEDLKTLEFLKTSKFSRFLLTLCGVEFKLGARGNTDRFTASGIFGGRQNGGRITKCRRS